MKPKYCVTHYADGIDVYGPFDTFPMAKSFAQRFARGRWVEYDVVSDEPNNFLVNNGDMEEISAQPLFLPKMAFYN